MSLSIYLSFHQSSCFKALFLSLTMPWAEQSYWYYLLCLALLCPACLVISLAPHSSLIPPAFQFSRRLASRVCVCCWGGWLRVRVFKVWQHELRSALFSNVRLPKVSVMCGLFPFSVSVSLSSWFYLLYFLFLASHLFFLVFFSFYSLIFALFC